MTAASHLILVGLPGAGKTTAGRLAARLLGRPFLDLDAEIERREGCTVAELFASRGEAYFRECEWELTAELRDAKEPLVLAPGGGWVTVPGVVALLRPPGRIIYLEVSPARALERLEAPSEPSRPLLRRADPEAALRELAERRRTLYEAAADHVLATDLVTVQEVAELVAELASGRRGR